ncbi:NAD(P)H-dependent flavin oxidoreductase [Paracraurococcus ruber]|uniref:NAD(P)H-dependent flavin oxidoreductase n=1 Tax=Paracraurococcus ruber TaxID=77675 RepID=UPI0013052738|nr:nitronate monooxygenase [Paracraurococcus ruber]
MSGILAASVSATAASRQTGHSFIAPLARLRASAEHRQAGGPVRVPGPRPFPHKHSLYQHWHLAAAANRKQDHHSAPATEFPGGNAMVTTRFTRLIGCALPIQQAGMGSASPPELVAAVSNAGGLGMLGTARAGLTAETLPVLLDQVMALTSRPFGVNIIVSPIHLAGQTNRPPLDLRIVTRAARRAKVVEFFYGEPNQRLVDMAHEEGALVGWQVGSRAEAIAAETVGCDFIIAQGVEAGGHVRGTIGTFTLLGEVLDAVSLPVLAAGGIGTRRGVEAALAAGADGVRVGTRFVATTEANAHPDYVQALIDARAEDTVYTGAFSVGWPDAPHRVLRSCLEAAEAASDGPVATIERLGGGAVPIGRYATGVADRSASGSIAAMSLWAGESVSAVTRLQTAADVIAELCGTHDLPNSGAASAG